MTLSQTTIQILLDVLMKHIQFEFICVSCFTTASNMDLYAMGWYANEPDRFSGLFMEKSQFLRRKKLIPL